MTGQDATARLVTARAALLEAAERCAETGAQLDPARVGGFGDGVPDALGRLTAALDGGGDHTGLGEAARGLVVAVTTRVADVVDSGLGDPGLAFIGSVLTMRTRLLVLGNAAADCEAADRAGRADG